MTRKIAIVGAGPSGCYLAQALLKLDKTLEVDILDRLPVPYGLARYGVAPDHQGTKAVTRQFARLFERQGVGFIGNLDVTTGDHPGDISLEDLRTLFDVVVLATGLPEDNCLGIEGEDLSGVIGSGQLTRAWNDHPDAQAPLPHPGPRAVVIGNGNVAMDVARILAKAETDFEGSDFGAHHAEQIAKAQVHRIEVIGRSPAHLAKFDPVMVKELSKIDGLSVEVHDLDDTADDPKTQALRDLVAASSRAPRCTLSFRFGWAPVRFAGEAGSLTETHIARADGSASMALPCDLAVTAIGFSEDFRLGRAALLDGAEDIGAGRIAPGLYAAGWFRRGPRGTIPENRADSQAVAQAIIDDLPKLHTSDAPGRSALFSRFPRLTDYAAWQRIDEHERSTCPPGRVRAKLRHRQHMLDMALTEDSL